ncbi:MAG: beta-lactamase family protein [Rhodobacteraceae bacterium]|jgi:CubicO group peptidase (beta-lactamase class C family)|nr:beta-lactamase family protein [Paracoccaceae bacterium]
MSVTNANLREHIESLIRFEVEDKEIPSISYTLVGRDEALARGHVQRRGLENSLSDKTRFRIASQTKMFTSICLMQLVEKKLVDIDVPVSAYLLGFEPKNPFRSNTPGPFGDDVTLRKLLSHTSGMIREPKSGHYLDVGNPPLSQTVSELTNVVLKNDPSKGVFSYSNAGIGIVGEVVSRVSGQSYSDYLTTNVLEPLGMNDSAIASTPEILANLAPASMWTLDGDTPAPVFDLGGAPAGNIYATLPDMEKFMMALMRGGFTPDGQRIVSPSSLAQMWQVVGQRPAGYAGLRGYGLGFGVSEIDGWLSVGHGGAVYGFASQLSVMPQAGIGMLAISTLDCSNNVANRVTEDGLRLALAAHNMGNPPKPRTKYTSISDDQIQSLPGLFKCDDENEFASIREKDGKLYLFGDGMPLQIKPKGKGSDFAIDGRLYGEGSDYEYLDLSFPDPDKMIWKGKVWSKTAQINEAMAGPELAPHLGDYGPDISITILTYENGSLMCLIEYFHSHRCTLVEGNCYKMHGSLYPEETLELGAEDEAGIRGIRVGPMFLARRP